MAWTEPIDDRTIDDIHARNSKAFMNIVDWVRIKDNTEYLNILSMYVDMGVAGLAPTLIPQLGYHWNAAQVNPTVENILLMRTYAMLPDAYYDSQTLKHDYVGGPSAETVDYITINAWERAQRQLNVGMRSASAYYVRCGVAAAGQDRPYQWRWRRGPNTPA